MTPEERQNQEAAGCILLVALTGLVFSVVTLVVGAKLGIREERERAIQAGAGEYYYSSEKDKIDFRYKGK